MFLFHVCVLSERNLLQEEFSPQNLHLSRPQKRALRSAFQRSSQIDTELEGGVVFVVFNHIG